MSVGPIPPSSRFRVVLILLMLLQCSSVYPQKAPTPAPKKFQCYQCEGNLKKDPGCGKIKPIKVDCPTGVCKLVRNQAENKFILDCAKPWGVKQENWFKCIQEKVNQRNKMCWKASAAVQKDCKSKLSRSEDLVDLLAAGGATTPSKTATTPKPINGTTAKPAREGPIEMCLCRANLCNTEDYPNKKSKGVPTALPGVTQITYLIISVGVVMIGGIVITPRKWLGPLFM